MKISFIYNFIDFVDFYVCRDRNIISRTFYYASFVMSRKTDAHFPDVCKKVLRCERVQTAIKEAAKDEFQELQEEEAGKYIVI